MSNSSLGEIGNWKWWLKLLDFCGDSRMSLPSPGMQTGLTKRHCTELTAETKLNSASLECLPVGECSFFFLRYIEHRNSGNSWTNSGEQILCLGIASASESQLPVHCSAKKSSCWAGKKKTTTHNKTIWFPKSIQLLHFLPRICWQGN